MPHFEVTWEEHHRRVVQATSAEEARLWWRNASDPELAGSVQDFYDLHVSELDTTEAIIVGQAHAGDGNSLQGHTHGVLVATHAATSFSALPGRNSRQWRVLSPFQPLDAIRQEREIGAQAVYEYPVGDDLVLVALDFDDAYDLHRYALTPQGWTVRILAQDVDAGAVLAELARQVKNGEP